MWEDLHKMTLGEVIKPAGDSARGAFKGRAHASLLKFPK